MQACLKALLHTVPGQRVNCIPGITALTDKRRLVETLVRTYGEGAFQIVPRTFMLPEQYLEWRAWIRAHVVGHSGVYSQEQPERQAREMPRSPKQHRWSVPVTWALQ
jgi:hypothetical protein